jgi:hypothetical protein
MICRCRHQQNPPLLCDECGGTGISHCCEGASACNELEQPGYATKSLRERSGSADARQHG